MTLHDITWHYMTLHDIHTYMHTCIPTYLHTYIHTYMPIPTNLRRYIHTTPNPPHRGGGGEAEVPCMIVGFQGGSTPNPRNHPHRGGGLQACTIFIYIYCVYIYKIKKYIYIHIHTLCLTRFLLPERSKTSSKNCSKTPKRTLQFFPRVPERRILLKRAEIIRLHILISHTCGAPGHHPT